MGYQENFDDSERNRILNLYEFDLDYSQLEDAFKDLTYLAAKISGTSISLINLIDNYTQWSVSRIGMDTEQMPREESICQYTILEDDHFEVKNLAEDDRFKSRSYVREPLGLNYYFGVPLETESGHRIGALCVLDRDVKNLSADKIDLLKKIASEIMTRLEMLRTVQDLKNRLAIEKTTLKKASHDIRGPLSGIIGVTQLVQSQLEDKQLDDIKEMLSLIFKSSKSLLDLTDEILHAEKNSISTTVDEINLDLLKEKLLRLYLPQAIPKQINMNVEISSLNRDLYFPKQKLLHIVGNLVSNAIKFTPEKGNIDIELALVEEFRVNQLLIRVKDNGIGLTTDEIQNILSEVKDSNTGTNGEKGFGFGLKMVKQMVESLNGSLTISSIPQQGACFEVKIPIR